MIKQCKICGKEIECKSVAKKFCTECLKVRNRELTKLRRREVRKKLAEVIITPTDECVDIIKELLAVVSYLRPEGRYRSEYYDLKQKAKAIIKEREGM